MKAASIAWLACETLALAGSAFLRFYRTGYSFEDGDQLQYLLGAYRHIYVDFVPGDWMVWQTDHYHVAYTCLVRAVHWLTGEAWFAHGVLVAHALGLVALSYAVLALTKALEAPRAAGVVAMFAVALLQGSSLGASVLNHGQFLAADLAHVPFLLCCAAWLRREHVRAGVFLGLSGLLHANYATVGPLVMVAAELGSWASSMRLGPCGMTSGTAWLAMARPALRSLSRLLLPFVVIASPSLVMVVRATLLAPVDGQEVLRFLLERAPHHYDMGTFRTRDWLYPLVSAAVAAPALNARLAHRDRMRWLLGIFCALLLLAFVGSELASPTVVQLRVWRISVPLQTMLLVLASEAVVRALRDGGLGMRAWGGLALSLLFLARFDDALVRTGSQALAAAATLLFVAGLASWVVARRELLATLSVFATCAGLAGWLWLDPGARMAPRAAWESAHKPGRILLRAGPGPTVRALYHRLRRDIAPDARMLVPPTLGDFRLSARRAMFVDWKSTPMRGDQALEWVRRIRRVAGGPLRSVGFAQRRELDARYARRTALQLSTLAREEQLTHVVAVRDLPEAERAGLERLFRAGKYVVYAVLPAARSLSGSFRWTPEGWTAGTRP